MEMRQPARAGNLWLAKTLWDLGAVQFGDFTLGRSTFHSPVYINLRLLISKPRALRRAARLMSEEVRSLQSMRRPHVAPFDRVTGIPFGGLHLATAFSLSSNVPMVYIHPAKERDTATPFLEGIYHRGETVLLLDDLVTSGGNVIEAAAFLGLSGLKVKDIVVLMDRQEGARERLKANGYNLISILGLESLLNYLMASGKIDEDSYRKSIDYMNSRQTD